MKPLFGFLALTCLVFVPACQESEGPLKTAGNSDQASEVNRPDDSPLAKPTVELLDAGKEPRQALRYQFQPGQTETMRITTDTLLEMSGMQNMRMKIPTQVLMMELRVDEIKESGEMVLSSELTKVDALNTPGVPAQVVNSVRQQTRQLVGMTSSTEQTDRGVVIRADMNLPDSVTGQMRQLAEGFKSSAEQASTPLPEEPVGVGGKWQVAQTLKINGMKMNQTATYTVTELTDKQVKLDVKIEQSAPSQQMTPPGQTQSVQLESYTGSGEGTMVMELGKIVPTSNLRIRNTNVVSQGSPSKLTTRGDLKIKISPE